MMQELFRIPVPDWVPYVGREIPVFGYGLMLVLGFYFGMQLMRFLARRSGLDSDLFVNCALIALVFGIAGARLSHVLENLEQYTRADRTAWQNLLAAVNIRSGGLTFFGGLLLATPACILYGLAKKIPIRLGMDIVAPALMVGLAFGRVGCFLNGCCYGAECNLPRPLSVEFPYHSNAYIDQVEKGTIQPPPELTTDYGSGRLLDPAEFRGNAVLTRKAEAEHSHPVLASQLFSSVNALLIAATLVAFFSLAPAPGRVFALMLILKGTTRFLLEMLRAEPTVLGPLSFSMVVSIPLVIAGVAMWWVVGRMDRGRPAFEPVPVPA